MATRGTTLGSGRRSAAGGRRQTEMADRWHLAVPALSLHRPAQSPFVKARFCHQAAVAQRQPSGSPACPAPSQPQQQERRPWWRRAAGGHLLPCSRPLETNAHRRLQLPAAPTPRLTAPTRFPLQAKVGGGTCSRRRRRRRNRALVERAAGSSSSGSRWPSRLRRPVPAAAPAAPA